jgi:ATP-binding cassette subfamily F protein uup
MGFKEKHALETLPKKLEGLRAEVQRLQAVLADASLFARDPAAFKRTLADLEAAQAALSAGEDQWLELEMLREELES